MLNDIFKTVGPIIAAALAEKAGKADGAKFRFGGREFRWEGEDVGGIALDELDLTAQAPTRITLAGPTRLRLVQGDAWRISASGTGSETLRFILRDGQLSILPPTQGATSDGSPEIELALPAVHALAVSGSGQIETETLAAEARLSIFGAGRIVARSVRCEELKTVIAGSGFVQAEGEVERLKVNVTGSGTAKMRGLTVQTARIVLAGSGKAVLSSDGEVSAKLMGAGDVIIHGSPRCSVRGMGSGHIQIVPEGREDAPDAPDAPPPPKPPKPPEPPVAPVPPVPPGSGSSSGGAAQAVPDETSTSSTDD
ncbi:GIN domain-containing protein [Alteriqipengyuania sp. 357]